MVLHDNETAIDFLYYESIAQTIKELLDDADDKPMTNGTLIKPINVRELITSLASLLSCDREELRQQVLQNLVKLED